jgi:hypothetical protein
MQALDIFISSIHGFEGDIPIPAIPVSTRSPGGESASDSSAGASVRASKTRTGKRKAVAYLISHKKTKKAAGKSSSGIKIIEPAPKASPALTPPSDSRQKIPIHQLKKVYMS